MNLLPAILFQSSCFPIVRLPINISLKHVNLSSCPSVSLYPSISLPALLSIRPPGRPKQNTDASQLSPLHMHEGALTDTKVPGEGEGEKGEGEEWGGTEGREVGGQERGRNRRRRGEGEGRKGARRGSSPVMKEFFVHELFVGRPRSRGNVFVSVNKHKMHENPKKPTRPAITLAHFNKTRGGNEGTRIEQKFKKSPSRHQIFTRMQDGMTTLHADSFLILLK